MRTAIGGERYTCTLSREERIVIEASLVMPERGGCVASRLVSGMELVLLLKRKKNRNAHCPMVSAHTF